MSKEFPSSVKRVENCDTSQSWQTITSMVLPVLLNKDWRCEANYLALAWKLQPVSNMCSQVQQIQPVHVLLSFPVIPELRNKTLVLIHCRFLFLILVIQHHWEFTGRNADISKKCILIIRLLEFLQNGVLNWNSFVSKANQNFLY